MNDPEDDTDYDYDERAETHSLQDAVRQPIFWFSLGVMMVIIGSVVWKIKDFICYVLFDVV